MKFRILRNQTFAFIFTIICLMGHAQNKEINILSINDMHAQIDNFPKFIALLDSMRTLYPDLLLFSAGDNRTGNPANDMHEISSFPMITLMNRANFNLSAVGNHEFDGNIAGIRTMLNKSNFRYVSANIIHPDSLRLHIEPYRFFEIDGITIAVLGIIQQGINGLPDSHPDNLKNITFLPMEKSIEKYSWLRNHCDIFILLIHEGYEESIELAQQFPFFDMIISGHSHTPVKTTEIHNGVLITQAESGIKYVTHSTLKLTDKKITNKEAYLLNIRDFSHGNSEVQAIVDIFNNDESLLRVVTQVITDFENYEELGCMMTDAIRFETNADLALQNPGGVRFHTFPKGPITVRDIYRLDPFNNNVIEFELTGAEFLLLIEAAYNAESKQPPYISGATYDIEIDKNAQIKKIDIKMSDGTKFDIKRKYKVVLNSYLSAVSKYEKADPGKDTHRTSASMTIEYLEKQKSIDYNGVKRVFVK